MTCTGPGGTVFKYGLHDNVLAPFNRDAPSEKYLGHIYTRVVGENGALSYHIYFPEDSQTALFVPEELISPQKKHASGFWSKKRDEFFQQTFVNPARGDGNKKGTYTILEIASIDERINKYVCKHADGSYPYYFDIGHVLRILSQVSKKKRKTKNSKPKG